MIRTLTIFNYKTLLVLSCLTAMAISTGSSTYPYYCQPSDRGNVMCPQIYIGVCGWFNSNVNCLVAPCANTSSNICEACRDPNVEKVTYGDCKYQQYPILTVDDFSTPYKCTDADRKLTCNSIQMENPRMVCAYEHKRSIKHKHSKKVAVCDACSDPKIHWVKNCN